MNSLSDLNKIPLQNSSILIIFISILGQCLKDTFSVTGSFGTKVPTICGINTNQHSKYEDAFFYCNMDCLISNGGI